MYWNHRVILTRMPDGVDVAGIHEVYYENNEPFAHTESAVGVVATSDDEEGMVESMRVTLTRMLEALEKPPLRAEDFKE